MPCVASFILLANIGNQRLRPLHLNFEGGDQRIFRVNDNMSRFTLKFKADRESHLSSPAFQHSKDSTIQSADVKQLNPVAQSHPCAPYRHFQLQTLGVLLLG